MGAQHPGYICAESVQFPCQPFPRLYGRTSTHIELHGAGRQETIYRAQECARFTHRAQVTWESRLWYGDVEGQSVLEPTPHSYRRNWTTSLTHGVTNPTMQSKN